MMVMMYMTMIASMLVLTYKRINKVGYKTAVRRISFELNEFIIKLIVKECGGDPSLVFRNKNKMSFWFFESLPNTPDCKSAYRLVKIVLLQLFNHSA